MDDAKKDDIVITRDVKVLDSSGNVIATLSGPMVIDPNLRTITLVRPK